MELAASSGSGQKGRRWARWVAGYAGVLLVLSWPAWLQPGPSIAMVAPTPHMPGANADPLFGLWWMDWVWSHPSEVLRGEAHCPDLFFPFGLDLRLLASFQNILILALEPLGSALTAYNVSWALAFLFAALATAALAFEISGSLPGAFLAGLLTAFGPGFYMHSLHHVHKLLAFGWLPLFLLCLHRSLRRGGAGAHLATLACATLILASDWLNALYAAIASSILWLAWLVDRKTSGRWRRTAVLALMLPILVAFLWWALGSVPTAEPEMLVATRADRIKESVDLLNIVLPYPHHAVLGSWSAPHLNALPGTPTEKTAFFGWVLPALLALGAWRYRRDRRMWPWLSIAAVFLVLALGPVLQWKGEALARMPGWWLQGLPGFSADRTPGRFALVTYVALGVVLASVVSHLRRPARASAAVALLIAVEFAPFATPFASPRVSRALSSLGDLPATGTVLDVPFRVGVPRYLFDQTLHRRPLVSGHAARLTGRHTRHPAEIPGFDIFRDPAEAPLPTDADALAASLQDLLRVEHVVLHKEFLPRWEEARRRLLASGLPLRPTAEDADVVVLRLDTAGVPQASVTDAPLIAGTEAFYSRALIQGWGRGADGQTSLLWGRGRWQRLALAPPRGARALELEVIPYLGTVAQKNQRLTIETVEGVELFDLGPGWQEVVLPVPPSPPTPWTLTFRVERTGRPSALEPGGSPDRRDLAVGLRRLRWKE